MNQSLEDVTDNMSDKLVSNVSVEAGCDEDCQERFHQLQAHSSKWNISIFYALETFALLLNILAAVEILSIQLRTKSGHFGLKVLQLR